MYTISSITDDTHLVLTTNYGGSTSGTVKMASGLSLAGTPTTTCGSPVVGVANRRAITLTGTPLTGTITVNNGSATVTGTGSAFSSEIGAGRRLNLPFQLTGTVGVTQGSATVTGAGTSFLTQLSAGGIIRINSVDYYISAIASNTSLTLVAPYPGTTASGLTANGYGNYTVQSVTNNTTLTLTANYSSAANLSGYTVSPGLAGGNSTCTVTATVKANGEGRRYNTTGLITSRESGENTGAGGFATDTLDAVMPPVISKSFSPDTIPSAGVSKLTFYIANINPSYTMTGVAFTDPLPGGVTVASPSGASTSGCGTPTWNVGVSPLSFTGGTILPGATCTASVNVTASTVTSYVNTSNTVSHIVNGATINGNTATDTLTVTAVSPALALKKQVGTSSSGPWYDNVIIAAGSQVWYRFTVENTGDAPLYNVRVNDDILGSPVTCQTAIPSPLPVAVSANENHIAYCIVQGSNAIIGSLTNTARAQGQYPNGGTTYYSNYDSVSYMNGNFGHLPSNYLNMNMWADGGAFAVNGTSYLGNYIPGMPGCPAPGCPAESNGVNGPNYVPQGADDGVYWTGNWTDGTGEAHIDVTCAVGKTCYLVGYVDWNKDGDFNDLNETVYNGVIANGGTNISFPFPGGGTLPDGTYYTRFRLYDQPPTTYSPNGVAWTNATPPASPKAIVGEVEDFYIKMSGGSTPTPVTVSTFLAKRSGNSVTFNWTTATETGNAGFNLYVDDGGLMKKVNASLIPSKAFDSLHTQSYTYKLDVQGEVFYIEDVALDGTTRLHGPFTVGESYGQTIMDEPVNWTLFQNLTASLRSQRQVAMKNQLRVPRAALQPEKPGNPVLQLSNSINLKVRQSGIQRVTYEALKAAGLDLNGIPLRKITVTNRGQMIPVYVSGLAKFGPGSYIEFYGEALDTLYTDTNIYTVQVSSSAAPQILTVSGTPARGNETPTASFTRTLVVNNQKYYANSAPGTDPWYEKALFVYTTQASWNFAFQVDGLANAASPSSLDLVVWGMTSLPQIPDHRLQVSVNGVSVADATFDGLVEHTLRINLPANTLKAGANTLMLTLPGNTGAAYDIVYLDKFSVTYERTFAAQDGRLTFTSNGRNFSVTNLPGSTVLVYRIENGNPVRLNQVKVTASNGTYTASFSGLGRTATYLVTTIPALNTPSLEAVRLNTDINKPADYLIISHPDFISGLQPFVAAKQAQGLTVNVVDVNDVFAQYSYGIFDPQGIKAYITYAHNALGTEYVLLVGGDTYDYRNFLGRNSISYIPSLYANTDPDSRFVPSDPMYADLDGDNAPDLAIGRFPVRSTAQLDLMINKTLAYQNKNYGKTAVFASDAYDGVENYEYISNAMGFSLPEDWSLTMLSMDRLPITTAHDQLVAAMNRGTALVNFVGHSGPAMWSQPTAYGYLFTTSDATALANTGKPFVVVQWGCWNTYYVDPINTFLVQKFLFSGDKGAAAVLGASGMTDSKSEEKLGILLTPRLGTPGMTIGQALQDAKYELAQTDPDLLDVLLGWSLMGDPALIIVP
jgi:hypothetical protein